MIFNNYDIKIKVVICSLSLCVVILLRAPAWGCVRGIQWELVSCGASRRSRACLVSRVSRARATALEAASSGDVTESERTLLIFPSYLSPAAKQKRTRLESRVLRTPQIGDLRPWPQAGFGRPGRGRTVYGAFAPPHGPSQFPRPCAPWPWSGCVSFAGPAAARFPLSPRRFVGVLQR